MNIIKSYTATLIRPVFQVDCGAGIYDSGAGIYDSGARIIDSSAGIIDSGAGIYMRGVRSGGRIYTFAVLLAWGAGDVGCSMAVSRGAGCRVINFGCLCFGRLAWASVLCRWRGICGWLVLECGPSSLL